MGIVVLHFLLGTFGALALFLIFARLAGVTQFSAPFAVLFIGLSCGVLAHFLSPWATPAILLLYAVASANELRQDRAARAAQAEPLSRKPPDT